MISWLHYSCTSQGSSENNVAFIDLSLILRIICGKTILCQRSDLFLCVVEEGEMNSVKFCKPLLLLITLCILLCTSRAFKITMWMQKEVWDSYHRVKFWVITKWFHDQRASELGYVMFIRLKLKGSERDLLVPVSWRWFSTFGLVKWLRIKGFRNDVALYKWALPSSAVLNAADLRIKVLRREDSLFAVKVVTRILRKF